MPQNAGISTEHSDTMSCPPRREARGSIRGALARILGERAGGLGVGGGGERGVGLRAGSREMGRGIGRDKEREIKRTATTSKAG